MLNQGMNVGKLTLKGYYISVRPTTWTRTNARVGNWVDKKAQVILMWVEAPGVGNASHPWILRVTRVRS